MEMRSRRKTLLIHGVPETKGEKLDVTVTKILSQHLTLTNHLEISQHLGITKSWTKDGRIVVIGPDGTRKYIISMAELIIVATESQAPTQGLKAAASTSSANSDPKLATHFFPNCTPSKLDLMITSRAEHVVTHGQFSADAFSYHDLIYLSYKIRPPKVKPTVVMRRSFKNFNNDCFMSDLNNINWDSILGANTADDKISIFNSILTELLDKHAPLRPIKLKHLPAPWLTQDIPGTDGEA
ncbi:jg13461 [Pararge aegeria aegeria]|uniref:Jg13461 protein n=1 Tax=Pararge aegeria aegeria TaxID=348720 RepID=A0A8S4QZX4_9NEOP|nr:jg13461 [Pararge aegeria aegeria]